MSYNFKCALTSFVQFFKQFEIKKEDKKIENNHVLGLILDTKTVFFSLGN
jgi:hypothetical protein